MVTPYNSWVCFEIREPPPIPKMLPFSRKPTDFQGHTEGCCTNIWHFCWLWSLNFRWTCENFRKTSITKTMVEVATEVGSRSQLEGMTVVIPGGANNMCPPGRQGAMSENFWVWWTHPEVLWMFWGVRSWSLMMISQTLPQEMGTWVNWQAPPLELLHGQSFVVSDYGLLGQNHGKYRWCFWVNLDFLIVWLVALGISGSPVKGISINISIYTHHPYIYII